MSLSSNILHLEDDDDDSFLFARALEQLGFRGLYRRVASTEEAMEYLSKSGRFSDATLHPTPDVFVTDSTATAPRLMTWLNARPEFGQLVRIVLTGGIRQADQERWIALGFKSVLSKGGSLEELAAAVKEILR